MAHTIYTLRLGNKMVDFHHLSSSQYISVGYYAAGTAYNSEGMYRYSKAKAIALWNAKVAEGFDRIT